MAITQLTERPRLVCKGTIGLGVKDPDKKFPEIADHFVLDDAPAVARVYGERPTSLDIMFVTEDLNVNVPAHYKFWSGQKRDAKGAIIDGTLACIGPGPSTDEHGVVTPGVATWRERGRLPPEAEILSERDQRTGSVQRACWGKTCVNADNCKQNMQVFCILPLVSPLDIYRVDTSSWKTMRSFFNTLNQIQMLGGRLAGRPFRIVKKEVPVTHWDEEKKKEFKTMKPLMFLEEWDQQEFLQLHGGKVQALQQQLQAGRIHLRLPTPEEAALLPSHELYPTEPHSPAAEAAQAQVASAEAVAGDPEVVQAFEAYGRDVLGRALTPKDRLIKVRQKAAQLAPGANLRAAVLAAITDALQAAASARAAPAEAVPVEPPPPREAGKAPKAAKAPPPPPPPERPVGNPLTPQPDADGII